MSVRFPITWMAFLERVFKATLLAGIFHVVGVSAHEEVIGIDTGRIITMVANDQAIGNWSIRYFPYVTTGGCAVQSSTNLPNNSSMSEFCLVSGVVPTTFRLCDFAPKEIWKPLAASRKVYLSCASMAAILIAPLFSLEFSSTALTLKLNHTKLTFSMVRAGGGLIPVARNFLTLLKPQLSGKAFCGCL